MIPLLSLKFLRVHIYSKEVLRQKRINHILGIELMEHSRPTLGDILDIKK